MKTKMIITALFAALSFTSCVNLMSKQNVPQQVKIWITRKSLSSCSP